MAKYKPGQQSIKAADINQAVRGARLALQQRGEKSGAGRSSRQSERAFNLTGVDLAPFDCCHFSGPPTGLSDYDFQYRRVLPLSLFNDLENVVYDDPVAVVTQSIASGKTGHVVVSGLTAARINTTADNRHYKYARGAPGETYLTPVNRGPARILWRPSTGTGLQLAWVILNQQAVESVFYKFVLNEAMRAAPDSYASADITGIYSGTPNSEVTLYDPMQILSTQAHHTSLQGVCIRHREVYYVISGQHSLAALNDVHLGVLGGGADGHLLTFDSGTLTWVNQSRADANIAAADHTHSGYATSSHTHDLSDISDSGVLAALDTVGTGQITNNAVSLGKLATIASGSLMGRTTAGFGTVETLTATQVRALLNVASGATADQTDAEIETAYNNQVAVVGQAEAEAGTATTVRRWTAQRVKQAIEALASSGSHTHVLADITDAGDLAALDTLAASLLTGLIADARVAQSNVTQHQAALAITESQISDLGSYAASSHTHTLSDISDAGALAAEDDITQSQISDLPALASTLEAEAGTETGERRWSPERIAEAVAALGGGGGNVDGGAAASVYLSAQSFDGGGA